VGHPSEIDEIFDAISYSKGASVIRMLHNFIGDSVSFRLGVLETLVSVSRCLGLGVGLGLLRLGLGLGLLVLDIYKYIYISVLLIIFTLYSIFWESHFTCGCQSFG